MNYSYLSVDELIQQNRELAEKNARLKKKSRKRGKALDKTRRELSGLRLKYDDSERQVNELLNIRNTNQLELYQEKQRCEELMLKVRELEERLSTATTVDVTPEQITATVKGNAISGASTKDLTDELSKREGVDASVLEAGSNYTFTPDRKARSILVFE